MSNPVFIFATANDQGERHLRNLSREIHLIRNEFENSHYAKKLKFYPIQNATISDIIDAFQKFEGDVVLFHFAGHGINNSIAVENYEGVGYEINNSEFKEFIVRQKNLKLVFLNACSTYAQSLELLESGLPVVISTRDLIGDEAAVHIAHRFYTGLCRGLDLDKAWADSIFEHTSYYKEDYSKRNIFFSQKIENDSNSPWTILFNESYPSIKHWSLQNLTKLEIDKEISRLQRELIMAKTERELYRIKFELDQLIQKNKDNFTLHALLKDVKYAIETQFSSPKISYPSEVDDNISYKRRSILPFLTISIILLIALIVWLWLFFF